MGFFKSRFGLGDGKRNQAFDQSMFRSYGSSPQPLPANHRVRLHWVARGGAGWSRINIIKKRFNQRIKNEFLTHQIILLSSIFC